jgi:hypothetical protein
VHADDDQIVPIANSALLTAKAGEAWIRASSDASTSRFTNSKFRDRVRALTPKGGVVWPSDLGTTRRPHRGLLTGRLPFKLPAKERSEWHLHFPFLLSPLGARTRPA